MVGVRVNCCHRIHQGSKRKDHHNVAPCSRTLSQYQPNVDIMKQLLHDDESSSSHPFDLNHHRQWPAVCQDPLYKIFHQDPPPAAQIWVLLVRIRCLLYRWNRIDIARQPVWPQALYCNRLMVVEENDENDDSSSSSH